MTDFWMGFLFGVFIVSLFLRYEKKKRVELEYINNSIKKDLIFWKAYSKIDEIYSVDRFNEWFNRPNNGSYANPGIFLRLDKLSSKMIEEYLESLGLIDAREFMYGTDCNLFIAFDKAIRDDWNKKIKEENEA